MFLVEVVEDKITNFYAVVNPDKLAGITIPQEAQQTVISTTAGPDGVTLR